MVDRDLNKYFLNITSKKVDINIHFSYRKVYILTHFSKIMYELKLLKLKEMPVFSLADAAQIVSGKFYAKKLLKKMLRRGEILKVKRDAYTFYDDPFLISTFIIKPSYISSASALSYHKMITQIPREVFCFTSGKEKVEQFQEKINFYHTPYFFGFKEEKYGGVSIPIATPEKAIIDSFGFIPVTVFEEAVTEINLGQMTDYLKKINKSCLLKRLGYLLEKNGFNFYPLLRKKINNRYIFYDPLMKKKGKKNKKWKLIINVR